MFVNLPAIIDRQKWLYEPLHQLFTGAVLISSWMVSPAVASPIAPANDGTGTTVTQEGNQFNINGGQLSGDSANLFHSFQEFGLDTNQIANFESNPAIQNILGRVVGGNASMINGLIQVTGGSSNLFLMNPAGIVFGANAQLNVPADFTATTSTGIGFSNGNYFQAVGDPTWAELVGNPASFQFGLSRPALVANFGELEVPSGQNLSLFGGQVFNAGSLSASGGNIAIASVPGETVLHISQPGHLLSLQITSMGQPAQNLANHAAIDPLLLPELLTGGITIDSANKIEQNSDGTISLTGSGISIDPNNLGLTVVSENIDVSGETGGNVQIFGDKVALVGTTVNADGLMGGGNVWVGGELQGGGTSPAASVTFVSNDSSISANGLDRGDGGQVIFWADKINRFNGEVTATGGVNGGNGGFVEISAQENLEFRGTVDVSSPQGMSGTILLDPKNITIADGGSDAIADNDIFSENTTSDVTFDGDDIAQLNGDVILEANNDITVDEEIVSDSVDRLEFRAGRSINVNANIDTSASNGNIILTGNDHSKGNTTERESGVANIQMAAGTSLNSGNGNIELSLGSLGEVGTITADQLQTTGSVSVNANGGNIRRTNSDSLINAGGAAFETNGEGGIGLDAEPIRLEGDNLEAIAGSGGAFFELPNRGVTVGGVTDNLTGISTTGGGDVRLEAIGNSEISNITVTEDIFTNVEDKENAGNITLTTTGAIATTGALLSSTTEKGDSGAIALNADGAIATGNIFSRSGFDTQGDEINGSKGSGGIITLQSTNSTIDSSAGILDSRSSGGGAGQIKLTADGDILTGFILASSQGPSANFSEGGIIEMTSLNGSIDTTAGDLFQEVQITEDTDLSSANAIFSLFNSTEWANLESYAVGGSGGNIILSAYGDVTTSYVNSFGKKGGGQINFSSVTGSINTANLFSVSDSEIAGKISLTTQDGAINTANLFSFSDSGTAGDIILKTENGAIATQELNSFSDSGTAGNINLDATSDITTSNINAFSSQQGGGSVNITALGDVTLGDISTYGFTEGGAITIGSDGDIDTTAGNLESFSQEGMGGNISLTALGSISTNNIATNGAVTSGNVSLESEANSVNTNEIKTVDDTTSTSGEITINFYEATGDIQNAELTSVGDVQTITVTNDDGEAIVESDATTDNSESTDDEPISIQFSPEEETTTETNDESNDPTDNESNDPTDNDPSSSDDSTTTDPNSNSSQSDRTTDPISPPTDEVTNTGTSDDSDNSVSDPPIATENQTDPTEQSDSNVVETIASNDLPETAIADDNNVSDVTDSTPTENSTTIANESNTVVESITTERGQTVAVSETSRQESVSSPRQNSSNKFTYYYSFSRTITSSIIRFTQTIASSQQVQNSPMTIESDRTDLNIENTALTLNDPIVNEVSSERSPATAEVTAENSQTTLNNVETVQTEETIDSGSQNQISSEQSRTTAAETRETSSNNLVNEANAIDTPLTGAPTNPSTVNVVSVNPASTDLLDNDDDENADEADLEIEEKDNLDNDEPNLAEENNEPEFSIPQVNEMSAIGDRNNSAGTSSELDSSFPVNSDRSTNNVIEVQPENQIYTELSQDNSQTVVPEIVVPAIESSAENVSQANSTSQPAESSTESSSGDPVASQGNRVPFKQVMAIEQRRKDEFEEYFGLNLESQFITAASAKEMLGTIEDRTNQKSAIVYITANDDQLELIVFTAKGEPILYPVRTAKRELLIETIQNFQLEITLPFKHKTTSYLPLAQQLYQWLITPIEPALQNEGIDTILFSMDEGLRSLPIAALHDGDQFLIEKYSLSFIPSVSLMDPRYHSLQKSKVLAMGADTFPDMNPLPAVGLELEVITQHLPGMLLFNEEFTPENLRQIRQQDSYDIVHLATHADFLPGPIDNAFIYFWNQKLNLEDLRSLGLQNPAAELLVLSACRTAVGDRDSELGFAGLAIRTGVKSVLASLWYVDDIGTLGFMTQFYQNLGSATIKAEALRQAQIAMIREEIKLEDHQLKLEDQEKGWKDVVLPSTLDVQEDTTFSHPYYWAGFTMIGSPW